MLTHGKVSAKHLIIEMDMEVAIRIRPCARPICPILTYVVLQAEGTPLDFTYG